MSNGSGGTDVPQISAEDLYARSLMELIQLRNDLAKLKWELRLESATQKRREEFAELHARLLNRLRDLTNAKLSKIAADLQANEAALSAGIQACKDARRRFETIGKAFKAMSAFLNTLETVLKVAAKAL